MHSEEPLFTNPPVALSDLPSVDDLEMTSLDPDYRKVRVIGSALFAVFFIVAAWAVTLARPEIRPAGYFVSGALTLAALWIVYYQSFSFRYMGYAVRDRDITFREGWLWRTTATVPFNRVQHCDIRQGLVERRFGLAKLTIYTAGGESSDIEIPGLRHDHAEQLKSFILKGTELAVEQE
jgi:hypothetical protein